MQNHTENPLVTDTTCGDTVKLLLDRTLEQTCINTGFLEQTRCQLLETATASLRYFLFV